MRKFLTKKFFLVIIVCFSFISNNLYASEQVASTQRQGIDIAVFKEGAGSIVRVSKNTISSIDKFSLPNPSRIIVDITGIKLGRTEFIQASNAPYIKMIRFGARGANVTRMVIDLNTAQIPQFTATLNQGTILIYVGDVQAPSNINIPAQGGSPSVLGATRLGDDQGAKLPSNLPPTREIQRPSEIKLPTAAPTIAIPTSVPTVAVPTPLPTIEPVAPKMPEVELPKVEDNIPTQEEELSNEGGGCTLNSVSFDKDVSGSSIAKIKLNKKAKFKIETASKEIYKVIVPNCKLISDKLNFPYFPSSEYKKFVFIQANQINDNVEVTVAVDENTKLNYLQRENEIWVKPQS